MTKRRCLRCSALTNGSHCPAHKAEAQRELNAPEWEHARDLALARDNHRCVRCGSPDRLIVDHIIERPKGTNAQANLMTLCLGCHNRKTAGG